MLVILRYFGWHPYLCFPPLRLLTTTATQQQGESIEHDHGYEQQVVADEHTEVLQSSSDHNAEQVRGEGDVSGLAIAERVGEDDVGQEHRREGQRTREDVADDRVVQQQRLGRQEDVQDEDAEQQKVDGGNALDFEAPVEQDRQQHAAED